MSNDISKESGAGQDKHNEPVNVYDSSHGKYNDAAEGNTKTSHEPPNQPSPFSIGGK